MSEEEYGTFQQTSESKMITGLALGLQSRGIRSAGVPSTADAGGGAAMQRDGGVLEVPLKQMAGSEVPTGSGAVEIAAKEPAALADMEMQDIENELDARAGDERARARELLATSAAIDVNKQIDAELITSPNYLEQLLLMCEKIQFDPAIIK